MSAIGPTKVLEVIKRRKVIACQFCGMYQPTTTYDTHELLCEDNPKRTIKFSSLGKRFYVKPPQPAPNPAPETQWVEVWDKGTNIYHIFLEDAEKMVQQKYLMRIGQHMYAVRLFTLTLVDAIKAAQKAGAPR